MDLGGWILLLLVVLYFVPLTLAVWRGHPRAMAIMAVSIAFGWTGVGWLAALVWSMTGPNYRQAPKTQHLDGTQHLTETQHGDRPQQLDNAQAVHDDGARPGA